MANLTNFGENLVVRWLLTANAVTRPTAWFVALGTGSGETGVTGEPSGNGYARQAVTFNDSGDTASNTGTLSFGPVTGTSWGTMSHFGIYDASTGGNALIHAALAASVVADVGTTVTVAIGALTATAA